MSKKINYNNKQLKVIIEKLETNRLNIVRIVERKELVYNNIKKNNLNTWMLKHELNFWRKNYFKLLKQLKYFRKQYDQITLEEVINEK